MAGGKAPKEGALTEYRRQVPKDERESMEEALTSIDLADMDNISAVYTGLLAALVGGKMSPEVAGECREILGAATLLAAARAQGIFTSETALDGAQALAAAAANVRNRRAIEHGDTEENKTNIPVDDIEDGFDDSY